MIPSLVVRHLREAIVEYLATTFALNDDDTRAALSAFLDDPAAGIFRGPYLRVRTPYRRVDDDWRPPLEWMPAGFRPYRHQAAAMQRLSSATGDPQPTIVTTGTGSGKTECFLYPILDHCARARAADEAGIKALVLYPMNALAGDQARRLARLLHDEAALGGVTAGLYVGGTGRHSKAGRDHLVDDRSVLRADPPDILLTNYKMLDFLLLRAEDRNLWAANRPDTLRYVVLDEFHTYDGAQGTDVAMLLRRLGRTLAMADRAGPLGAATPVATSATLGSGTEATAALRDFAARVFGTDFDAASVVTEERESIEQACRPVDYTLPIPEVDDVLAVPEGDDRALAEIFTGRLVTGAGTPDPVALGELLLAHPLTRAVLAAANERTRSWRHALDTAITRAPSWGARAQHDAAAVETALARYVGLLSIARRPGPGDTQRPLFSIEVQLWVREVSRLLRTVATEPDFRWLDSGAAVTDAAADPAAAAAPELPATYCRHCGHSGWMAVASEFDDRMLMRPREVYRQAADRAATVRALLKAPAGDPRALHFDAAGGVVSTDAGDGTVAVYMSDDEADARAQTCPACGSRDGIRFLGTQVASLASVSISNIFGSELVAEGERKLLAFTDSVQDASHRAAFLAGRSHRFNLRGAIARFVTDAGGATLDEIGPGLVAAALGAPDRDARLYGLVPSDLLHDPRLASAWTGDAAAGTLALLETRLAFEAALELGLHSRVGRTLELTGSLAAAVDIADPAAIAALVVEAHAHLPGDVEVTAHDEDYECYTAGLLERLRLGGGIMHPWLIPYVRDGGTLWHIWGGRPEGMQPFPRGRSIPTFFVDGPARTFTSLTAAASTATWPVDWAMRCLGVDAATARALNRRTLALLAHEGLVVTEHSSKGDVYGLDPARIVVVGIGGDAHSGIDDHLLRCDVCRHRFVAPPATAPRWERTPCQRYRCPGRYDLVDADDNYYRRLYRSGSLHRVVTAEHTGLLTRSEREDLEEEFKAGTDPAAPNVIACTPTLEMGIDIGDLSAVMLTSVPHTPASYLQRVGRAGRATGNALVTTFVPTDRHGLYYLSEPENMLAGEVRPPNCYLDAIEILRRQYFAYLVDRSVDGGIETAPMPRKTGVLVNSGLDPGGWLHDLLDAATLGAAEHVHEFTSLFGDSLQAGSVEGLHEFATGGLELAVKAAFEDWRQRYAELTRRRDRLKTAIESLDQKGHVDDESQAELRRLRGERTAIIALMRHMREEYSLSALEGMGLLPNYTLLDDATTMVANLWWREDDEFRTSRREYQRSAQVALTEFAPGNSFYTGGHRHVVDTLEIGSASEPLYETWQLCPDCAFGTITEGAALVKACPRCGTSAIGDAGTRHTMLRLRTVSATSSEEDARVYDDRDEREREFYTTVAQVDVDANDIVHAWRHTGETFGMELDRTATVRRVNLGLQGRPGETISIAGRKFNAPRFRTCRHCGAVFGLTGPDSGRHQGWCMVRSGARAETWDHPLLYHSYQTEAVRLLLPVSMFEVDERLASFTAALLLGLRLDFGGEPDHIRVMRADHPDPQGVGRLQMLVIHENVPGGTGYLGRIGDPDRLQRILVKARDAISACQCRNEGAAACHRCLLGTADQRDIDLVSRQLALELLDRLLDTWDFEPVQTISTLDISGVEESELERRFKAALREWADEDEATTLTSAPAPAGYEAFELRIDTGDAGVRRYLIEEQRDLDTSPSTRPDFLISRQDAAAPEIAVYLDGFAFHAAPETNNLDDDAAKRDAVRRSGRLVWNLTWHDVEAFHKAAAADIPKKPPPQPLLALREKQVADVVQHDRKGRLDVTDAFANPVTLLMHYLSEPDAHEWERLACSVVAGAFSSAAAARLDTDAIADSVTSALEGGDPGGDPAGDGGVHVAVHTTAHGLALACYLDARVSGGADAERWTVVASLPDDGVAVEESGHKNRWRDWLQWANLLQFLHTDDREAVITTTTHAAELDVGDLSITPGTTSAATAAPAAPTPASDLAAAAAEELELILDDSARALAEAAIRAGVPVPVAGHEPDAGSEGWVVEVAWPQRRVAIVTDDDADRDTWLRDHGWTVRPAAEWTAADLIDSLKGN
ncbi:MAG: DEAD/DEAH box helicase [Acidimicrobiia bacterium]|nr:DEAD/DEAH box helicase [Acidimicrobiia bacterium]